MYLRSRRATISVKAVGVPSRSVPAAARPRGSRAPLPPGWRRPTRNHTPRRLTSRSPHTWKSGKINTKTRSENTKLIYLNPKKVSLPFFLVKLKSLFLQILKSDLRMSQYRPGRMQTKTPVENPIRVFVGLCQMITCCFYINSWSSPILADAGYLKFLLLYTKFTYSKHWYDFRLL